MFRIIFRISMMVPKIAQILLKNIPLSRKPKALVISSDEIDGFIKYTNELTVKPQRLITYISYGS